MFVISVVSHFEPNRKLWLGKDSIFTDTKEHAGQYPTLFGAYGAMVERGRREGIKPNWNREYSFTIEQVRPIVNFEVVRTVA